MGCTKCGDRLLGCAWCRPPTKPVMGIVVPVQASLDTAMTKLGADTRRMAEAKALAARLRRRLDAGEQVGMDEVGILVDALLG